ncbi:MAG TPA: sugar ABC transporter permease [Polyangiaceae bacterium]|jgi:multiple sugar transport system permease protein|nr:sugar ABC transporter permease [Polyangiaceae bacterium]
MSALPSTGEGKERRAGRLMMAPAVLVLVAVALYPTLASIWLSFQRLILVFHERRFVGMGNYAFLVRDARFFSALGHTVYFTVVSVTAELVLGLVFALLLHARPPAKNLLRAAILVPWAMPTVVSAKMWALFFLGENGLPFFGISIFDVNWLGTPGYAMHAAIAVDVWKTTPFVALLLLAGLVGIPQSLYDAAALDGASSLRTFFAVTLPVLRRILAVTVLLRALDAFRVFDVVYVLTDGGPANTTETLSVYAYKTMMRGGDFGYGSTLATATFLCVLAMGGLYFLVIDSEEETR